MGRKASYFEKGLRVLIELDAPIFKIMAQRNCGLPVMPKAAATLFHSFPRKRQNRYWRAYKQLRMSWRYSRAVAQEGAMRHDLRGNPVEPVSEASRADALANLGAISARWKAIRDAAKAQQQGATA